MTTLRDLGEFGIIERIARIVPASPNVVEGIGDDCAVVRVGEELLAVTCDLMIQDVHFRLDEAHLESIGWKTAAVSLSDVAAMGGVPAFATVACGAPSDMPVDHLEQIFTGLNECLSAYGAVLVGGDTTCSEQGLILDLTLVGRLPDGYTTRAGAKPGDVIAVTGYPGRSAAGLQAQETGLAEVSLIEAHIRPTPRVAEGQWLNGRVNAMIDLSDGLVQDAGHIAEASGLTVNLDALAVPIADDLAEFCEGLDADPQTLALAGGEDYELAVALPGDEAEAICKAFETEFNLPLTPIGTCETGPAEIKVNGETMESGGFDHFRGR